MKKYFLRKSLSTQGKAHELHQRKSFQEAFSAHVPIEEYVK